MKSGLVILVVLDIVGLSFHNHIPRFIPGITTSGTSTVIRLPLLETNLPCGRQKTAVIVSHCIRAVPTITDASFRAAYLPTPANSYSRTRAALCTSKSARIPCVSYLLPVGNAWDKVARVPAAFAACSAQLNRVRSTATPSGRATHDVRA